MGLQDAQYLEIFSVSILVCFTRTNYCISFSDSVMPTANKYYSSPIKNKRWTESSLVMLGTCSITDRIDIIKLKCQKVQQMVKRHNPSTAWKKNREAGDTLGDFICRSPPSAKKRQVCPVQRLWFSPIATIGVVKSSISSISDIIKFAGIHLVCPFPRFFTLIAAGIASKVNQSGWVSLIKFAAIGE